MTATATATKRRSLADQIDRLDSILDGLAEGLDDAVADAVRNALSEAAENAVRTQLGKAFSDPETLSKIAAMSEPKAKPGPHEALARRCRKMTNAGRQRLGRIRTGLRERRAAMGSVLHRQAAQLWAWRKPIGVAGLVGLAAVLFVLFAGPALTATVCGIATFALTVGPAARRGITPDASSLADGPDDLPGDVPGEEQTRETLPDLAVN